MFRSDDVIEYLGEVLQIPVEDARRLAMAMELGAVPGTQDAEIRPGKIGLEIVRHVLEVEAFRRALRTCDVERGAVVRNDVRG